MKEKLYPILLLSLIASCRKTERTTMPSGLQKERITTLACYEGQPKMSSDGKFIAYISTQAGDKHVWLYDVKEKNTEPLTSNEGADEGASFSPDDQRMVFSSKIEGQEDLWLINQDGQLQQVTKTDHADEFSPSWSKDGGEVLFVRKDSSGYAICKVNLKNVSGIMTLRRDSVAMDYPQWIPGQERIIFETIHGGRFEIRTFRPGEDASDPFSDSAMSARFPAVSPDGNWLAFAGREDDFFDIYVTRIELFDPHAVTREEMDHFHPSWSSDGRSILYESAPRWGIHMMEVETQKDSVLVDEPENENTSPVFTPDGKRIIFTGESKGHRTLQEFTLESQKYSPLTLYGMMGNCYDADISPDRKNLVLTRERDSQENLCLMAYDTLHWHDSKGQKAYGYGAPMPIISDSIRRHHAKFSPDGKWIVYVSERSGSSDIWRMELATTKETRLTVDERSELCPSFSNDGEFVYFQTNWAKRWSIWQMPVEGGLPLPVTRDKLPYGWDAAPVVSSRGNILAFTRSWYDDADIWIMSLSGGEKTTRTLTKDNTNQELNGRWSPDGKYVVYQAGHNTDIWMVEVSSMIHE